VIIRFLNSPSLSGEFPYNSAPKCTQKFKEEKTKYFFKKFKKKNLNLNIFFSYVKSGLMWMKKKSFN
jgi:hypothetical protein